MSRLSSGLVAGASNPRSLITFACAAPPNARIVDAETALKAAKAAGAEHSVAAAESYKQAVDAYRKANEAVTGSDYRLALSKALESREHSQAAEREAAEEQARARDEVLQTMTEVATLLSRAGTELESAERRRVPRPVLRNARDALAAVDVDVQKASAAIQAAGLCGSESNVDRGEGASRPDAGVTRRQERGAATATHAVVAVRENCAADRLLRLKVRLSGCPAATFALYASNPKNAGPHMKR
jgi:hypothetical protein